MKICTFFINADQFKTKRTGLILEDGNILNVQECFIDYYRYKNYYSPEIRGAYKCPLSLFDLLQKVESPLDTFKEAISIKDFLLSKDYFLKNSILKFSDVTLCCPLDKIGTYRDFYAFEEHVAKGFAKRKEPIPQEWYEMPVYYKGNPNSFIGPNEKVIWPSYSNVLDYELEIGIIIGRDGKNISKSKACDHILGISILNDISARDIQRKEMAVRLGPSKGKDFCTILGPIIVTLDEFESKIPNLEMSAFINGEKKSHGFLGDLYHSIESMIEFTSSEEWLVAGDVIGTGTVGTGCGLETDSYPRKGDVIELTVEKIGTLKNYF